MNSEVLLANFAFLLEAKLRFTNTCENSLEEEMTSIKIAIGSSLFQRISLSFYTVCIMKYPRTCSNGPQLPLYKRDSILKKKQPLAEMTPENFHYRYA